MSLRFLTRTLAAAAAALLMAAHSSAAVDVNKASAADLDGIKGIGPSTSTRILDERKKGSFKDWSDLISRVGGIGEKSAVRLSGNGLTVNGAAFDGLASEPRPAPAKAKK